MQNLGYLINSRNNAIFVQFSGKLESVKASGPLQMTQGIKYLKCKTEWSHNLG